jgi:DNA-binding response OmpR family regulator
MLKHTQNIQTNILLLEDDRLFCETLADFLGEEGFDVDMAYDPYTALEMAFAKHYDIYLFDVNLPFESGFDLLAKLREGEDITPTIFITSREDKESILAGFDAGADDYIRKPIDLDELRARIYAVLRRKDGAERIRLGEYEIDILAKRLWRDGEEIELGRRLFELLHMLVSAHGETVSTERILMELWPRDKEASYGALRVYITRLKKLFGKRIENIRGVGYRFVGKDDDA